MLVDAQGNPIASDEEAKALAEKHSKVLAALLQVFDDHKLSPDEGCVAMVNLWTNICTQMPYQIWDRLLPSTLDMMANQAGRIQQLKRGEAKIAESLAQGNPQVAPS